MDEYVLNKAQDLKHLIRNCDTSLSYISFFAEKKESFSLFYMSEYTYFGIDIANICKKDSQFYESLKKLIVESQTRFKKELDLL